MRRLSNIGKVMALAAMSAAAGMASPILFSGTFSTDDQVELIPFTVTLTGPVTIQSYSYAGGMAGSIAIPAGGFAPYATIFALVGTDYVQSTSDNGGHCGVTQMDSVTGNCDDIFLQTTLSAGTYFLALSVWDNVPVTGTLSDGFQQSGNPGFTCAEGGLTGQFCDVTDALYRTRTGAWALTISGIDNGTGSISPEPSTLWLILSASLLGAWRLRPRHC